MVGKSTTSVCLRAYCNFEASEALLSYHTTGSFTYYNEASKNVEARSGHAQTSQELIPTQDIHAVYHQNLRLREERLAKARKASRRQTIRATLYESAVIDADLFSPMLGAMVRLDSADSAVEQLASIEKQHTHAPITTGLAYYQIIKAAKEHDKPLSGHVMDSAGKVLQAMPQRLHITGVLAKALETVE